MQGASESILRPQNPQVAKKGTVDPGRLPAALACQPKHLTALQTGACPFDEATLSEVGYACEQLVRPHAVSDILVAPQDGP